MVKDGVELEVNTARKRRVNGRRVDCKVGRNTPFSSFCELLARAAG